MALSRSNAPPHLSSFPPLNEPCPTYDGALYIATCLAAGSVDHAAVIYGAKNPALVHAETEEMYRVFRSDDPKRDALDLADWEIIGWFTRGPVIATAEQVFGRPAPSAG